MICGHLHLLHSKSKQKPSVGGIYQMGLESRIVRGPCEVLFCPLKALRMGDHDRRSALTRDRLLTLGLLVRDSIPRFAKERFRRYELQFL